MGKAKQETNQTIETISEWLSEKIEEDDKCRGKFLKISPPGNSSVNEWSYKDERSSACKCRDFLLQWVTPEKGASDELVKALKEQTKHNSDMVRNVIMNVSSTSEDLLVRTQYVNLSHPAGSKTQEQLEKLAAKAAAKVSKRAANKQKRAETGGPTATKKEGKGKTEGGVKKSIKKKSPKAAKAVEKKTSVKKK